MNVIIPLSIGLLAATVGSRIGLPGAPIVLPILAVTAWHLLDLRHEGPAPQWLQTIAFGLLATSIGLSIDRSALVAVGATWPLLLLMAFSVYAAASVVMLVIARLLHVDLATAMLAGSPGGLTGVSAVSLSAGANVGQVIAVQTLRLLIVYASLPALIAVLRHFR